MSKIQIMINRLREAAFGQIQCPTQYRALMCDAADTLQEMGTDLKNCRNELCLKCGDYKNAHQGACDGCRWRDAE